jgi:hypothetical protein
MKKSSLSVAVALVATLVVVPLVCVACGGGSADPAKAVDDGYVALGKSDWKAAQSDFDAALATLKSTDAGYLRAKLGQIEALIHLDAAKAKQEFLALAKGMSSQVEPKHFIAVASNLTSEKKYVDAVDVLEAGLNAHSEDPKLRAVGEEIKKAASKAGDDKALAALKGLGYLGD